MKSLKKQDLIKIRKALATAYHKKGKTGVNEPPRDGIMGRIRSLGPLYPKTGFFELFQLLVWRLVPVTCVLVLVLGAAVTQLDFLSANDLAKMFLEDPADYGLFALFV